MNDAVLLAEDKPASKDDLPPHLKKLLQVGEADAELRAELREPSRAAAEQPGFRAGRESRLALPPEPDARPAAQGPREVAALSASFYVGSTDPAHILNRKNSLGLSPLYLACRSGNLQVVKFLCHQRCDLNLECHGETPLAAAARWNQKAVVEFLLQHVKDPLVIRRACSRAPSESVRESFRAAGFETSSSCCSLI